MTKRKLMTIDDLVKFCREQNFTRFSSKESGYKLAVQVPTTFEIEENVDEAHRGMLKLKFRIFHTGLNRNGSFVSEDAAKNAMPTIKNRPILAAIHQLDNGEWDFESHNFEVVKNEETGEDEIVYIEKQVGSFDESEPFFEYDEDLDKTFICSYGYIPEEYTKAADIIRRKNGTKNSCELSIDELSFNAKESYLSLDKFYVAASTLLGSKKDGTEIGEGMLGSRADIADFSEQKNSMQFDINEELLNEIKKLNENLTHFSINQNHRKEEQFVESNEILEEVVEEVVEATEDTVTEVTEEVVEENFEETTEESTEEVVTEETSEETTEESTEVTPEVVDEEEVSEETEEVVVQNSINYSVNDKTFAVSLDDIQFALNTLVNDTYSEQDGCYYATTIYEDHLVMVDFWTGKAYRQSYKKRKDVYSLTGDRVPVKSCWLSADEEQAIDDMRKNFTEVSEKLAKYEEEPAKMEIINSESYAKIVKTKEFTELRDNHFDLSIEEVSAKADEILLTYAKNGNLNFSAEPEKKTVGMTRLPIQTSTNKKSRYGSLKFN